MNRFASAAAIAGVVLAGAVATAPSAFAGDRTCRGTLGSGTVNGNIRVPAGATCTLRLTKGNVIVAKNGTLRSHSARVDGNHQCKSNVPAPKGARNKVKGNKEGQCRRF